LIDTLIVAIVIAIIFICLLQLISITCYADRCISYYNRFHLSVFLSVRHNISKWFKLRLCGLHWTI